MADFWSSLSWAKRPWPKDDTSDPAIFSQQEYLAVVCMKEQRNADSKTVQGGRGEFSGSAQIHVYMSEFRAMNLAGGSKETFAR